MNKTNKKKVGRPSLPIKKCNFCKYETRFKRSMLLHNLNNHYTKAQRKEIFPYYCEHCDYGSFIKTTYEKHLTKNKSHLRLLL